MYIAMGLLVMASVVVYGMRKWRELAATHLVKDAARVKKRTRFKENHTDDASPTSRTGKNGKAQFGQRGAI